MNAIKIVAKIILTLLGILMLAGGGICAASNAFFGLLGGFGEGSLMLLGLFLLSAAIAAIGWQLFKLGMGSKDTGTLDATGVEDTQNDDSERSDGSKR